MPVLDHIKLSGTTKGRLAIPAQPSNQITAENFVYQGAFRIPAPDVSQGRVLAFNPDGNEGAGSLYCAGAGRDIGEITIPTPVDTENWNELPIATVLQTWMEPTEGQYANMLPPPTYDPNYATLGGLLVYNGQLIISMYNFYGESPYGGHFTRPLDLSDTGHVGGPYYVTNDAESGLSTNFFNAYMCNMSAAHQAAIGAPCLTGNSTLNVISNTSWGPSAFGFDPADLGVDDPVITLKDVLYYISTHPCDGEPGDPWFQSSKWNAASNCNGIAFPDNFDTLLFFGKQGTGPFLYGTDPTDLCFGGTQGNHCYPYRYQIWAYDVNTLLAASNPWDTSPTFWWWQADYSAVEMRHSNNCHFGFGGVTEDKANNLIYAIINTGSTVPTVNVYQVT